MTDGFKNVYVVELVDTTVNHHRIVGIFEAEGLAEMARRELDNGLSGFDLAAGIFHRITAYEIGKIYG